MTSWDKLIKHEPVTPNLRYRLYHTKQNAIIPFPRKRELEFYPEFTFRAFALLVFGTSESCIVNSFMVGSQEQLACSAPAIHFVVPRITIEDVEKWTGDGNLEYALERLRVGRLALPSTKTDKVVVELSEEVDCICVCGIELPE